MPIRSWYYGNSVLTSLSAGYHVYLILQIKRHYISKRAQYLGYLAEFIIFTWQVFGNFIYYWDNSDCEDNAPVLWNIMLDLLIIGYIRLLRIITLILFLIMCLPVYFVLMLFNRRPNRSASKKLLKHLSKFKFASIKEQTSDPTCAICLDDF